MALVRLLAALPLAPLRGLVALAQQLERQSEQERERELAQLQADLLELELSRDGGEMRQEDLDAKEAELLRRVGALAGGAPPAGAATGDEE